MSIERLLSALDAMQAAFAQESIKKRPEDRMAAVTAGYNNGVFVGIDAVRNALLQELKDQELSELERLTGTGEAGSQRDSKKGLNNVYR